MVFVGRRKGTKKLFASCICEARATSRMQAFTKCLTVYDVIELREIYNFS